MGEDYSENLKGLKTEDNLDMITYLKDRIDIKNKQLALVDEKYTRVKGCDEKEINRLEKRIETITNDKNSEILLKNEIIYELVTILDYLRIDENLMGKYERFDKMNQDRTFLAILQGYSFNMKNVVKPIPTLKKEIEILKSKRELSLDEMLNLNVHDLLTIDDNKYMVISQGRNNYNIKNGEITFTTTVKRVYYE